MEIKIRSVREKVVEKLKTLVDDGTLGQVRSQSFGFDLLGSPSISKYPVAFVTSPSFFSEVADNTQNKRTYQFLIDVVFSGGSVRNNDYIVDEVKEKITNAFDQDFTLDGEVIQVMPVSSIAASSEIAGKRYIHFVCQIDIEVFVNVVQ